MKAAVVIAAAALALALPAAAQTTRAAADPADKDGDPKRLICQVQEQVGSRLGKRRVCLTAEEWNEKHKEHREFGERIQSGTWGRESAVTSPLDGLGPQ